MHRNWRYLSAFYTLCPLFRLQPWRSSAARPAPATPSRRLLPLPPLSPSRRRPRTFWTFSVRVPLWSLVCADSRFNSINSGIVYPVGVASPPPMTASDNNNRASEDLLQLAGNPFANMLNGRALINILRRKKFKKFKSVANYSIGWAFLAEAGTLKNRVGEV